MANLVGSEWVTITDQVDSQFTHACAYTCTYGTMFYSVMRRFQRHNLLLAGLWYGPKKPTMTTFLAPFVKEINSLSSTGEFLCMCLLCIVDLYMHTHVFVHRVSS